MIITKTPYRISFFGGGTDLNQWFKDNGGAVISTSIDKYCYISCRFLPKFFDHNFRFVYSQIENVLKIEDIKHPAIKGLLQHINWQQGIELHHDGDLPARSGLGSSSSFTVGMLNALSDLQGKYISKNELAKKAIFIEQKVLNENVGCQDQIAAAYGGFNKIEFFGEESFKVSPIIISEVRLNNLQDKTTHLYEIIKALFVNNKILLYYFGSDTNKFNGYLQKSDVYALGLTIFKILSNSNLLSNNSQLIDLLKHMIAFNPYDRYNIIQCINHPYFTINKT